MISILVSSIDLHAEWLERTDRSRQAYDYANKILSDLEKAGMRPPKYDKPLKYKKNKQLLVESIEDWEME